MTPAPPRPCPVCGGPAWDSLTVSYRYPRAECLPQAQDPWNVWGWSYLRTCGSVGCQADGLLAVVDEIITNTAVTHGRLLNPEDLVITRIGQRGDLTVFGGSDD